MKLNWKKMSGVIAIVGVLLLALAMVAFSQDGPPRGGRGEFHGGPGGPRDGLGPLGRDLNLTDDQKAQIKKIQESFEESTKTLREQARAQHESQPDPLSGGAFDEAAVRAAAEAHAKIQVELEVAHARMMSQIFAVLTTEQKTKLAAKRQEFEQRRQERRPPPDDAPSN
ncbi:MAG: motif family protein [Blastocatellia bacterium]|jgi:Spy/CpxP family protein refolding chaperone|nr:motif family protein [Blastocatellia bacterium]